MSGNLYDPKQVVLRPAQEILPFHDTAPRQKCSLCCAAYCASITGLISLSISIPSVLTQIGFYYDEITKKQTWRQFFVLNTNRLALVTVPLMAVSFTHAFIVSHALWSKNKKSMWDVNWESCVMNITLWLGLTACGTLFSRKYLVKNSHAYRLKYWEYTRERKKTQEWLPHISGTLTATHGFINQMWVINVYHIIMLYLTYLTDMEGNNNSVDLDNQFMRRCSPRWRQWSEIEMQREYYTAEKIRTDRRWGMHSLKDSWRS
eukprot:PhF_6_TR19527/c0_g1_i1/m.28498